MQFVFLAIWSSLTALAGGSFDHSHAQLDALWSNSASSAGVDYGYLQQNRAALDSYVQSLATAPVSEFTRDQKIAFWVNAYNALTVQLILDEKTPKSIMDLDGGKVWDTRSFKVGSGSHTLNDIEHRILRPMTDGRIHAVLNCASKGCPPLASKPIRSQSVDAQLTEGARHWVRTNAVKLQGSSVSVSQLFDWFADDFVQWRPHAPDTMNDKHRGAIGFLKAFGDDALKQKLTQVGSVTYHTYDWSLNSR